MADSRMRYRRPPARRGGAFGATLWTAFLTAAAIFGAMAWFGQLDRLVDPATASLREFLASPQPASPDRQAAAPETTSPGATAGIFSETGSRVKMPAAMSMMPPSHFAIELGSAFSFAELSARFAFIAEQNAESGIDALEPRAILVDTNFGVEARLLVGPFDDASKAGEACGALALPAGVGCRPVPFAGEVISRR